MQTSKARLNWPPAPPPPPPPKDPNRHLLTHPQNPGHHPDDPQTDTRKHPLTRQMPQDPPCTTASGNILASGNLCFRVFKLQ